MVPPARTGGGAALGLVDQIHCQSGESGLRVRRAGPRERDPGGRGLLGQFVVQIPHHLDVVGDEADRAIR